MKGLPILSAVKIYDSAVRRSQLFASMEPTFAHQVKDLHSQQQPDEEDKDKDCYKCKHKYEQRQKQHKNSLSDPSLIIGELPLSLTNWLTHPVTLSRLVWCDPGVWRCQLRTCRGCYVLLMLLMRIVLTTVCCRFGSLVSILLLMFGWGYEVESWSGLVKILSLS